MVTQVVRCSSSWCLTTGSGSYFPVPGAGSAAEAPKCIRVLHVLGIIVLGSVFSDPNWLQTGEWAVIIPSITVLFPMTRVGSLHNQGSPPGLQRPHWDPTLLAQASRSSLLLCTPAPEDLGAHMPGVPRTVLNRQMTTDTQRTYLGQQLLWPCSHRRAAARKEQWSQSIRASSSQQKGTRQARNQHSLALCH